MKFTTKILMVVLAISALSAPVFAADAAVGQNPKADCNQVQGDNQAKNGAVAAQQDDGTKKANEAGKADQ